MTILFGRTQQAFDVPFEPNRLGLEIESQTVQEAIEEVKLDAFNNDRFLLLAAYNGNANAGRYLEFFSGIDSSIAPIIYAVSARVTDIVLATVSANATCTLQFVDVAPAVPVVLYTVTMTSQKRVIISGDPVFFIPANTQLGLRVASGSIGRPHIYFNSSANT